MSRAEASRTRRRVRRAHHFRARRNPLKTRKEIKRLSIEGVAGRVLVNPGCPCRLAAGRTSAIPCRWCRRRARRRKSCWCAFFGASCLPHLLPLQKLPEQYEQLLSGQVMASEIRADPNALKSVIAFVVGNFVAEGTSREPESMPPESKRGDAKRMVRQPRKREVAQSEILQLKQVPLPRSRVLFSPLSSRGEPSCVSYLVRCTHLSHLVDSSSPLLPLEPSTPRPRLGWPGSSRAGSFPAVVPK